MKNGKMEKFRKRNIGNSNYLEWIETELKSYKHTSIYVDKQKRK